MIRYQSIAALLAVGGCALGSDGPPDPQAIAGELQAAPFSVTVGGGFLTVNNESGLVYKVSQTSGDITSIQWNGKELNDQAKGSHLRPALPILHPVVAHHAAVRVEGGER